jgi:hypothetical protein
MPYGRDGVLTGQVIDLRAVVTDATGALIDTDSLPDVYIYDSSVDEDTIQSEIDALTFTSALAGPLAPTSISTGFYELEYTVPSGSVLGDWHDVWVGEIDTIPVSQILEFEVEGGGDIAAQVLRNNELIIIELDGTIAALVGTAVLGSDVLVSFSTIYNPLYASPDLLRMEIGPFLDFLPDDTLALMIHWSSLCADFICARLSCTDKKRLNFAKAKFVIYDAALRALLLPGASNLSGIGASGSGAKKQLADLSITKGGAGASIAVTSSGIDVETLNYIRDQRDMWERVVNAGGCIVPGQGLDPVGAIRGRYDIDRRASGRLWLNPELYDYPQPSTNVKVRRSGAQRGRFGFSDFRRLRRSFTKKRF